MKDEKISIIVPVYNSEKYIEKCIQSIINQTYKNIEIIIINDGSTDKTLDILNDIKDNRIIIFSQENAGVSSARNFGIEKCTTKYFMFVDSDDTIEKDAVVLLYNAMIENDCDIVMGNVEYSQLGTLVLTEDRYEYLFNNKIKYFMTCWNKLMKKELFNSLKYPNLKIAEDDYLIHHLLYETKKMVIIPNKTYNYRENKKGLSKSKLKYYKYAIYAIKDRYLFFQNTEYEKIAYKLYMNFCINTYCKLKEKNIKEKDIVYDFRKERINDKNIKYIAFSIFPNLYYRLYKIRRSLWKK